MKLGFRTALVRLAAIVLAATASTVVASPPAQAIGGESLGCRIAPGPAVDWALLCLNHWKAPKYNAGFAVLGMSGGGYTFVWRITGPYNHIITGCVETRYDCAVEVDGGMIDKEIEVQVTIWQGGQSVLRQANALIRGFCPHGELC